MHDNKTKVLVLGAGAVGLSIAGKLSGRCNVSVVCRKRHADAILKRGLLLKGIWGDKKASGICCFTSPEELKFADQKFDYILITSKSCDTQEISRNYRNILKNSNIVSIQNGIGNADILKKYSDNVIGATITTNFRSTGDGSVAVQSESEPMRLGFYLSESSVSENESLILERLISIFNESGISAEESPDIKSAIWEKSLLNIAVNPLTALLSIPVGKTQDDNLKHIISEMIYETFSVMSAEKISTRWKNAEEYLNYLFDYLIPSFSEVYTSMYQDIELRRHTEIDFMNGAVVKLGKKNNIKTPFNACICNLLQYKEKSLSLSQRTPDR